MSDVKLPGTAETFSLFGEPLHQSPINLWLPSDETAYKEKMMELRAKYELSLRNYLENPEEPENLLWLGRRTGILGRFREAVALYSLGVQKFPSDPRFLRFRGHRFAGRLDEPELYASGGPSKDKLGVSSFHWNVWYHLGFVYFAAGSLEKAAEAYRECMKVSDNPESVIATSHWLYMVLKRIGRNDEAVELLETIETRHQVVEVGDYHETLLMYKGETSPEALLEKARSEGSVRFLTRGHAIGNLYLSVGETERAIRIFREVLATSQWTSGVYLLSEVELKKLGVPPR
jgi:tetratricopeptide (TPR) repeat protein